MSDKLEQINIKIAFGGTWTVVCDMHLGEIARECGKLDVQFQDDIVIVGDSGDKCEICDNRRYPTTAGIARHVYDLAVKRACI